MSNPYMAEAKAIRASINGLAQGQPDEKIIDNKAAFPFWNGGGFFMKAGNYVQYENEVYKVLQDHTTQDDWKPNVATSLFSIVTVEQWKEWKPNTSYTKGTKVTHINKRWISNIDNNIWEPGAIGVYTWNEVI